MNHQHLHIITACREINDIRDASQFIPADSGPGLAFNGLVTAQNLCHGLAVHSGWWIDTETGEDVRTWPVKFLRLWVSAKIMLTVCELAEGYESYRKGDRNDDHLTHLNGMTVEFADAIVRLLDLSGGLGLDVPGAIIQKLAYNQKRLDHKVENRKAEGGKSI